MSNYRASTHAESRNLPLVQTVSPELWKHCYIFLVTAKHVKIDKHVVVSAKASVRVASILAFNAVGRCSRETSLKETGSVLRNNRLGFGCRFLLTKQSVVCNHFIDKVANESSALLPLDIAKASYQLVTRQNNQSSDVMPLAPRDSAGAQIPITSCPTRECAPDADICSALDDVSAERTTRISFGHSR